LTAGKVSILLSLVRALFSGGCVPPLKVNLPFVSILIFEEYQDYLFLLILLFIAFIISIQTNVTDKADTKLRPALPKIASKAAKEAIKTNIGSRNAATVLKTTEGPLVFPSFW
jgi:hypothetical protein